MSFNSLQAAGSTLRNLQMAIDSTSHNIANVNTTAFKEKRVNFEAITYGSSETKFSGSAVNSINTNFTQGKLKNTSQWTDLALQGNGFFTIQDTSGEIVFTRDGHFKVDSNSNLVTAGGNFVLSAGGGRVSIPAEARAIEVNASGEIKALMPGSEEFILVDQLQVASFLNPQGLEAIGSNFYRESLNSGIPEFSTALGVGTATADTAIKAGSLESSNADLSISFVDLIAYQRSYQAVSRSATTANDILETTLNL